MNVNAFTQNFMREGKFALTDVYVGPSSDDACPSANTSFEYIQGSLGYRFGGHNNIRGSRSNL